MKCFHCQNEIALERAVGRQETCPHCHSYLHCCRNCGLYDVKAWHECREPEAEWVKEKEGANFCVYFTPRQQGAGRVPDRSDAARRKLDDLFG